MARVWHMGDWVRVKATGLIFKIERFSTMDGCEDDPTCPNPAWKMGEYKHAMYLRFDPDELEEASALDRLTLI